MDPMTIIGTLGDKGLLLVVAAIGAYSWFTVWLAGGSVFAILGAVITNILLILLAICLLLVTGAVVMYVWSSMGSGGPSDWTPYIEVKDVALKTKYANSKIPMETAYEAYIKGKLDFKGDVYEIMQKHRYDIFQMRFNLEHGRFLLSKFIPMILTHTIDIDKKEIGDVYNRGNDFYRYFLGPRMLYTSGLFFNEEESLETAQDNKMNIACQKIHLKRGEKLLDIGCGWGTFICYAAEKFGAITTGVTISKEGAKYAQNLIEQGKFSESKTREQLIGDENLRGQANVLCMDYREIPAGKWDKITCFEMAEHVGVKNFQTFLSIVNDRLEDDGIFYLQIAGLRRPWIFEDFLWGLFMNKYIFPGADASCPLNWYVSQAETAGFEVRSVETIGIHYSKTLKHWYDNWLSNKEKIMKDYGDYWFRLWSIFLAWSVIAAGQGTATCYQIVLHKNTSSYNRKKFIGIRPWTSFREKNIKI